MKGLLLKELYLIVKYCRPFLLVAAVFLAASCFETGNTLYTFFPLLIAGMIPLTLISYDERDKWNLYCLALPYTRAQQVSAKYLLGLLCEFGVFALSAIVQLIRAAAAGGLSAGEFLPTLCALFVIGILAPGLLLPFVFRFGAEKGRLAYYVLLAAIGGIWITRAGSGFRLPDGLNRAAVLAGAAAAAVLIYAGSWGLSIFFYQRRDL